MGANRWVSPKHRCLDEALLHVKWQKSTGPSPLLNLFFLESYLCCPVTKPEEKQGRPMKVIPSSPWHYFPSVPRAEDISSEKDQFLCWLLCNKSSKTLKGSCSRCWFRASQSTEPISRRPLSTNRWHWGGHSWSTFQWKWGENLRRCPEAC